MVWNWAGTDIGKAHHYTVVLDNDGEVLLSRKVFNDEPELLNLISEVLALGEDVVWSVDVADGMACLLVNLLLNHEQTIVYLPGLAVNRASVGYRGLGKTDAKDARIIADQARMRRDLHVLTPEGELTAELRVMTDRRADLVKERDVEDQPSARSDTEHLPGLGTRPGIDEHRASGAAVGLPDVGRTAASRPTAADDVASQSQEA